MAGEAEGTADRPTDQELLAAFRAGGEDAATELFQRYYARLIELVGLTDLAGQGSTWH